MCFRQFVGLFSCHESTTVLQTVRVCVCVCVCALFIVMVMPCEPSLFYCLCFLSVSYSLLVSLCHPLFLSLVLQSSVCRVSCPNCSLLLPDTNVFFSFHSKNVHPLSLACACMQCFIQANSIQSCAMVKSTGFTP